MLDYSVQLDEDEEDIAGLRLRLGAKSEEM